MATFVPMILRNFICILFFSALASSCAYRMGLQGRSLPGKYSDLAIPIFKNKTHEVGIEVDFTNALIKEFKRSKVAKIRNQKESAIWLEGTIEGLEYLGIGEVAYTESGNELYKTGAAYRVLLRANIKLRRRSDRKVIWESGFTEEKVYNAPQVLPEPLNSANALYNHSARKISIQSIAKDMMAEVHDRLTENF